MGLFGLAERRIPWLREDLIVAFQYLKGLRREKQTNFVAVPVGKGEGVMVLN